MGVFNLKLEVENYQFQQPNFSNLLQTPTPVKTEADPAVLGQLVTQVANQLGQLTAAVGQVQQAMVGQAFTRAAPQIGTDAASLAEEVRKLTQRMDELEARTAKG